MTEPLKPEIDGHCPVAYFALDEAAEGKAEFSSTHDGKLYYFVSAEAKQEFESDPNKYVPAYGGRCAFGRVQSLWGADYAAVFAAWELFSP
jgi:YHS domain-containing protein